MVPEETKSCWGFLGSRNSDWLLHVPVLFFLSNVVDNCDRSCKVEKLFSLKSNRTNAEVRMVNLHLYYMSLNGFVFNILDLTHMSEFRADANPSSAGGKKHDDFMHWCLPGVTNIWNDLFIAHLSNI